MHEDQKRPLIGTPPTQDQGESPERLQAMLAAYSRHASVSSSRKARLTQLMGRRSARKWGPAKKAQMTRRYVAASRDAEQASNLVDLLQHRLEQVTTAAS